MDYLLHHLLSRAATSHPDRTAVVDGDRTVTYAELNARAGRLAHLLVDLGVMPGDRVGFYLDKSLESIVAIYGILKAGAAYVPFDPEAPPTRLAYMAANAGISVLLSGREKGLRWGDLLTHGAPLRSVVVLNAPEPDPAALPEGTAGYGTTDIDRRDRSGPDVAGTHLDLAYILYTSGSTGRPKGVMLSHLNALTFVQWAVDAFDVGPQDRLSGHAPLHFDLSIFDVFAAARAAATLVLVPAGTSMFPLEMAKFIAEADISVWYSVPSILSLLVQRGHLQPGSFPKLRTILFAGEVFPTKYLRRLMTTLPHVAFYNLYGPTETNVCTYFEVPPLPDDQTEAIPIGRAIANVEVFAVTDEGRPAAPGEVGELWVRGSTVMRGYWGDEGRTRKVLVEDPFRAEKDAVYRTGDLVRELEDGNYQLLGRRDHQVKSRGYRIELGEIESALYAHPDVVDCVAVAIPDDTITNRIKAFVVGRNGLTQAQLVRFCSGKIPRYMIPESFELLPALPKTSTGKVDRQALQGYQEPGVRRPA